MGLSVLLTKRCPTSTSAAKSTTSARTVNALKGIFKFQELVSERQKRGEEGREKKKEKGIPRGGHTGILVLLTKRPMVLSSSSMIVGEGITTAEGWGTRIGVEVASMRGSSGGAYSPDQNNSTTPTNKREYKERGQEEITQTSKFQEAVCKKFLLRASFLPDMA